MMTNQVILVGHVGTDPVFKKAKNDQFFVTFSLRVHDSWRDKEENRQTQTNWHPVSVWGEDLACHTFETILKGDKVRMEGKLKNHLWTDTEGKTQTAYEIVINRFFGSCFLLPVIKREETDHEKEEALLALFGHS